LLLGQAEQEIGQSVGVLATAFAGEGAIECVEAGGGLRLEVTIGVLAPVPTELDGGSMIW